MLVGGQKKGRPAAWPSQFAGGNRRRQPTTRHTGPTSNESACLCLQRRAVLRPCSCNTVLAAFYSKAAPSEGLAGNGAWHSMRKKDSRLTARAATAERLRGRASGWNWALPATHANRGCTTKKRRIGIGAAFMAAIERARSECDCSGRRRHAMVFTRAARACSGWGKDCRAPAATLKVCATGGRYAILTFAELWTGGRPSPLLARASDGHAPPAASSKNAPRPGPKGPLLCH